MLESFLSMFFLFYVEQHNLLKRTYLTEYINQTINELNGFDLKKYLFERISTHYCHGRTRVIA